ncbi:MAG: mandelate racemase/muconate lactonizing enzyme family protein [Acidobacteriota bacterium]
MRIVDASLRAVGGAVGDGLRNARRRWGRRRGLLLTLTDAQGHIGQGEATPLPGYSPDTVDQARTAIETWCQRADRGAPFDLTAPARDQVSARLDTIDPLCPSARFAVETALLDLLGQRLWQPVEALLGAPDDAAPVPISGLIVNRDADRAVADARALQARGVTVAKIKIGLATRVAASDPDAGWHDELDGLRAVRDAVGDALAIRLDANGSLPSGDLDARLAQLAAAAAPSLLEEPSCFGAWSVLARTPVPLALDEGLRQPAIRDEFDGLVDRDLCHALVLKPAVLGGALACLALARRAAARDVPTIVTHCFDGPIALAAAAALARALPGAVRPCGLAPHAGLDAWPAVPLPMLDARQVIGQVAPGLGLPSIAERL